MGQEPRCCSACWQRKDLGKSFCVSQIVFVCPWLMSQTKDICRKVNKMMNKIVLMFRWLQASSHMQLFWSHSDYGAPARLVSMGGRNKSFWKTIVMSRCLLKQQHRKWEISQKGKEVFQHQIVGNHLVILWKAALAKKWTLINSWWIDP